MATAKRIILGTADRELVRNYREAAGLSLAEAGSQAWPDLTPNSSKVRWSKLENDVGRPFSFEMLQEALGVVGLDIDATCELYEAE